jgi:hypothetical protein
MRHRLFLGIISFITDPPRKIATKRGQKRHRHSGAHLQDHLSELTKPQKSKLTIWPINKMAQLHLTPIGIQLGWIRGWIGLRTRTVCSLRSATRETYVGNIVATSDRAISKTEIMRFNMLPPSSCYSIFGLLHHSIPESCDGASSFYANAKWKSIDAKRKTCEVHPKSCPRCERSGNFRLTGVCRIICPGRRESVAASQPPPKAQPPGTAQANGPATQHKSGERQLMA